MCKFCEAMADYKKIDDFEKEQLPEYSRKYSVAIVRRTFVKGQRGCDTRRVDFRYRGCGYQLNFCPECGVRMKEG